MGFKAVPGYVIFIPPDVPHHFENLGDEAWKMPSCFGSGNSQV